MQKDQSSQPDNSREGTKYPDDTITYNVKVGDAMSPEPLE